MTDTFNIDDMLANREAGTHVCYFPKTSTGSTGMTNAPHCNASFINAIREEGTKTEACDYLQRTWDKLMQARTENRELAMQILATDGQAQEALARAVGAEAERDAAFAALVDIIDLGGVYGGSAYAAIADRIARAALVTK